MPARLLSFSPTLAQALKNSRFSIALTGGGGWLGQAALEMLDAVFGDDLPRRVTVFGSSPRMLTLRSGCSIASHTLSDIENLPKAEWLFFHFAFLTRDKVGQQSLESYISGNEAIAAHVARAIRNVGARGLFMPSSGAVYRADKSLETDMEKNPYGVLKVRDEKIFSELAVEQGFTAVIPRLFNLAGPFINKVQHYALSSMILAAQKGGPIVIRAPHRVVRSYTHVADLISLGAAILLNAQTPQTLIFDTAGTEQVEMSQLATAVIAALGASGLRIERPELDSSKEDVYYGDAANYHELAHQYGIVFRPLQEQIKDTAAYLGEIEKNKNAA